MNALSRIFIFVFSLFLISPLSYGAIQDASDFGPLTGAVIVKSNWNTYTRNPAPTVNCSRCYSISGQLQVTFRLSEEATTTVIGDGQPNMSNSGSDIEAAMCIDVGNQCSAAVLIPNLTCTAADKGLFYSCLRNRSGNTYTVVFNYSQNPVDPTSTNCIRLALSARSYFGNKPTVNTRSPICMVGGDSSLPDPEPEEAKSVCSLSGSVVNIDFASNSVNVANMARSSSIALSCSSGTVQNYQLKLTGSASTDGRLDFGNGVSAKITIDGKAILANGPSLQLPSLTSRSIPVSAELVGSAISSGTSSASGILILEAI